MSIFGTIITANAANGAGGTTLTTGTFNTHSGDLIVVASKGATTTNTMTVADVIGNAFDPLTAQAVSGQCTLQLSYCFSKSANSANAVTQTFNGTVGGRWIFVWDVPIVGGTAAFDTQAGNAISSSTATSITTSAFSTANSDGIVFAGVAANPSGGSSYGVTGYTVDDSSLALLGGAAHTKFTSPQSGITATGTWSGVTTTFAAIALAAFKGIPAQPASTGSFILLGCGHG